MPVPAAPFETGAGAILGHVSPAPLFSPFFPLARFRQLPDRRLSAVLLSRRRLADRAPALPDRPAGRRGRREI
jgi:hypothetical protein